MPTIRWRVTPKVTLLAATGFFCAFANSATAGWDECRQILKYPNGWGMQYSYFPQPTPPDPNAMTLEGTNDSKETVRAWYASALPDWQFSDHSSEYPPSWQFHKPGSNLGVSISLGTWPEEIQYMCW